MSVKYESNIAATASCVFPPSLTPFSSLLPGPTILSLVLTIPVSVFVIFILMFLYINNIVLHAMLLYVFYYNLIFWLSVMFFEIYLW